jgi:threonine dehydrogenase-like Zn-dependent dehydrogenase
MATHKAVHAASANAPLTIVDVETTPPGPGQCRRGQFMQCVNGQVPSLHYPGGYAESVTAPVTALARIPDELSFAEAAPMGCAGVTTYHALRRTKAVAGDRVAVLGIGGLGHLGVQWARLSGAGHPAGTSRDVEETMHFAVLSGVRGDGRGPCALPHGPDHVSPHRS